MPLASSDQVRSSFLHHGLPSCRFTHVGDYQRYYRRVGTITATIRRDVATMFAALPLGFKRVVACFPATSQQNARSGRFVLPMRLMH